MAELADAPDLGSGINDVGVQVSSGAPEIDKIQKESCRFFKIKYDYVLCEKDINPQVIL